MPEERHEGGGVREGLRPLWRVVGLWRGQSLWLWAGVLVALAGLLAWVGMMALAGLTLAGGAGLAAGAFRWLAPARVALRYGERLLTHAAMFRALADLRVWFFRGLARSAAGGLGFRRAGDVLARLVGDVDALDGVYLRILLPLAGAVLLAPLLAAMLWPFGPWVALAVLGLFLLAALGLPVAAARASLAAGGRLAAAAGAMRVAVLDALAGRREVRAFAAEGRMLALVQGREAALLAAQRALAGRVSWAGAAAFLCGQAALLAALLGLAAAPAAGVVAVFLALAAFEVVGGLPRAGALAGHAAAAAGRVLEAAEAPPAVAEPAVPAPAPASFALRCEGVCFAWGAQGPAVFDGLSLDVPPGGRIALLGPSGSGKSTLAALLLRQVAPLAGRITLGGVDIAALSGAELRRRIGWLAQGTHLFADTIRANLLLARPEADEAALWAALDAARIGDVVRALPARLETWLGEGGANFSGGEGRRLALARALLSPAPVLILDEPCAGLDAETERAFFDTLNEATAGRSVILIAHRLSGVERLDRIYRLSGGRAVAAAG